MGRLRRFPDQRFIGRRDQMLVYDCDEHDQFASLEQAVSELGLDQQCLLASFAPDTLVEARNRSFRPPRATRGR
jgi:hypothetical protein